MNTTRTGADSDFEGRLHHGLDRRELLWSAGAGLGLALTAGCGAGNEPVQSEADSRETKAGAEPSALFRISLAQWSFHRAIFGGRPSDWTRFARELRADPDSVLRGELDPLDFPATARSLGFAGVEYVNTFFFGHARDRAYLGELRSRCEDQGVQSLLIMCDNEGALGDPDERERTEAIERHVAWLEAASFLGCHSIRVNAQSEGAYEEQQKLAADGLRRLCERAEPFGIHVLVENHGGLSSNGAWLAAVIEAVDHPLAGTLPDFGNFELREGEWYDRYQGVHELMPFAKAVSAKSHDFDEDGNETSTDYRRMLGIVLDAGYRGWIGVEYEGTRLPEREGIVATRELLLRLRTELAPRYI